MVTDVDLAGKSSLCRGGVAVPRDHTGGPLTTEVGRGCAVDPRVVDVVEAAASAAVVVVVAVVAAANGDDAAGRGGRTAGAGIETAAVLCRTWGFDVINLASPSLVPTTCVRGNNGDVPFSEVEAELVEAVAPVVAFRLTPIVAPTDAAVPVMVGAVGGEFGDGSTITLILETAPVLEPEVGMGSEEVDDGPCCVLICFLHASMNTVNGYRSNRDINHLVGGEREIDMEKVDLDPQHTFSV